MSPWHIISIWDHQCIACRDLSTSWSMFGLDIHGRDYLAKHKWPSFSLNVGCNWLGELPTSLTWGRFSPEFWTWAAGSEENVLLNLGVGSRFGGEIGVTLHTREKTAKYKHQTLRPWKENMSPKLLGGTVRAVNPHFTLVPLDQRLLAKSLGERMWPISYGITFSVYPFCWSHWRSASGKEKTPNLLLNPWRSCTHTWSSTGVSITGYKTLQVSFPEAGTCTLACLCLQDTRESWRIFLGWYR